MEALGVIAMLLWIVGAASSAVLAALTENDLRGINTVMNTVQVLGLATIAMVAPVFLRRAKSEIKEDNFVKAEEIKTLVREVLEEQKNDHDK